MNKRLRISLACLTGAMAVLLIGAGITAWTSERGIWVDPSGNDTSAARNHQDRPFRTLAAAKTAASAGDTIFVNPGNYTNNNLLKAGVNYYFYPGASVYFKETVTNGPGYGIFDDRATGATTNAIGGFGNFYYDSGTNGIADGGNYYGNVNSYGLMVVTNALSDISFRANKLAVNTINFSGWTSAINVRSCRYFHADVEEISDPQYGNPVIMNDATFGPLSFDQTSCGIYWEYGDVYIRVGKVACSQYGIWCSEPTASTNTQNGYFVINSMQTKLYTTCKSTIYKGWFDFQDATMRNASGGGNGTVLDFAEGGGFFYVRAMKLGAAGPDAVLRIANSPSISNITAWVDTQKMSSTNHWMEVNGGFVKANVTEFEDPAGTVTNGIQVAAAGTLRLRGGFAAAGNNVVDYRGGNLSITGMELRSTNSPVVMLSGSGLGPTLTACTLIPKSTSNSVYATTAQPVRILGGSIKTAVHANVTMTGTTYTDSTLP